MPPQSSFDDPYTLLCVRADDVAPVVDLMVADEVSAVRAHAQALLREHLSCETVEIWRSGELLERVAR